jgi:selenide,water dikinase
VHLDWPAVPLLPGVRALAEQGFVTGASGRNWAGYGAEVTLGQGVTDLERALLTDPQTAGGLLVSCTPEALPEVQAVFARHGFAHSAVVGRVEAGQGLHVHG